MLSLRAKILTAATALVLLSQAGTVVTVLVTANRDVSERARLALAAGASVFEQSSANRADHLGNTVRALASDYGFKQAVATGDTSTVASALANHARRAHADRALLLGLDGEILAVSGALNPANRSGELLESVAAKELGRIALVEGDTAWEMFTVPVRAPLPVAWVAMGFALTDEYAKQLSDITGLQISMFTIRDGDARVIASSLGDEARGQLTGIIATPQPLRVSTAGPAGEEILAIDRPFIDDEGPVRVLLTKSLSEAMKPYAILQTAAIVLGALPLALALIGAALLSRAVTKPIHNLVEAAKRIQAGDYTHPVSVDSGDELSQFAIAFNSMQQEIARREERITYQAQHDSLTGMRNRNYLLKRLEIDLAGARQTDQALTVMVLGFEAVAEIESTLGHDIVDAYVRQAAERLQTLVADDHALARLEGDSFVIVLNGFDEDEACDLGENLLERLAIGVDLPNITVPVHPSIGIAVFPEHGVTPDQLLLHATIARRSEIDTRSRIGIYQQGDQEHRLRRMTMIADLRRAVRHDELMLDYQPKIRLSTGLVCGAEALVRWNHPTLGLLSPIEFIPIAEQSGNISILTRWALVAAARECRFWQERGLDLAVSVNLSARDLLDTDLPWFIMDVLKDHDLETRHLAVEITEEAVVHDFRPATAVLRRLREQGIRISIDDFGTGYSSLSQLKNLPVDELKIDRSFVTELPGNQADAAVVGAAIDLAHNLGLELVAEGIESQAAARWLRSKGADVAQGYFFSRPLPPEAFISWATEFQNRVTPFSRQLRAG